METNILYYGDNLDILRRYLPDESVDLVYLDPPFNSNRAYSVIFKDESGRGSDAQIEAFDDSWHWGPHAEATYAYLTNTARHGGKVPDTVSAIVGALRKGIRPSPMLAYLVEMAVRLVELHRVLKPTGSLYLHCDPTASHYLKIVLDAIFDPKSFVNEVVWKRSAAHSDRAQGSRHYGRLHDVILVYAKTGDYAWNQPYEPLSDDYVDSHYSHVEPATGRRYRLDNLTGPGGAAKGNPAYEVMGVTRYWRYSKARMQQLIDQGRVVQTRAGAVPQYKRFIDESGGRPVQDVWDDIAPVNSQAKERLGWGTQKPLGLLERIISTSTNPGDVVLDPFCGCGTALIASQKTGRRWIGIDITHLAIAVMRARLHDSFPDLGPVKVIGQPTEVEGARMLAQQSLDGRYEFQYWALSLVDAQPVGQKKKGADSGIDGKVTFSDVGGTVRDVLVSVKSGHVNVSQVRDLKGTMEREGAPLGLFITLEDPTEPMKMEAATAGVWHSELADRDYPRVQLLTIKELLDGKRPTLPLLVMPTYQQAEKVQQAPGQVELFGT